MNTASIKPNGCYTFSDEYLRRKCKRTYQDKTKYYAVKSKLFQTLCRVYVDDQKTISSHLPEISKRHVLTPPTRKSL